MGGRLDPATARARLLVRAGLADVGAGDTVVVGLSGGIDSLALTAVLAFIAPRRALRWGAVVVDHGLQPGSSEVAATAADQAHSLGAEIVRVAPAGIDHTCGAGPEGAARAARYAALREQADDLAAAAVLLAHTRDDQAETVLLGLARGSGSRSLAGMRPVAGLWRRPFLDLTRDETTAVCAAAGLTAWADPHNADSAFARSRVRVRVLPALEAELGPGVSAALARTADLLRADADLLDAQAVALLAAVRVTLAPLRTGVSGQIRHSQRMGEPAGPVGLRVDGLASAPEALRRRVLRMAALEAGASHSDLAAGHVEAVGALLSDWHGQRGIDLPGRVRAVRSGGVLRIGPVAD